MKTVKCGWIFTCCIFWRLLIVGLFKKVVILWRHNIPDYKFRDKEGGDKYKMTTLVLITISYPYGGITEAPFVEPEIDALSKNFDRVIIAPSVRLADSVRVCLPSNVIVSDELLLPRGVRKRLSGLMNEAGNYIKAVSAGGNPIREIAHNAYIGMTADGVGRLIKKYSLCKENTLFYTFWFDFQTAALSEIKDVRFISRAHGYDIYEDGRGYISRYWRRRTLSRIKALYPASEYGADYIRKHYPEYGHKILARRLGSRLPLGANPQAGGDGTVCLCCARMSPEKGVVRLVELLLRYAQENPRLNITYHHIGDGVLIGELRVLKAKAPGNLEILIHGTLPNAEVHRFLRDTHVDFSLLLSESEGGLPVSICESMSYGIPVIATGICGVPEIFRGGGGITISSDARYGEFADAIATVLSDPQRFRSEARINWERNFSAQELRSEFAREAAACLQG